MLRVDMDDPRYPPLLREIADPPRQLYACGDLSALDAPCIAVVGARKATEYGRWAAFQLSKRLAGCGATVVSGMAAGIDRSAHEGAMAAGGKTVAVLGCGPDVCYPQSNRLLMAQIQEEGLILSEYEPGTGPRPWMFPLRNRIISGLSISTVIVEAGLRSGSLITAERAAEQGRTVFAVPGNINRRSSFGCNKLIQDGATPVVVLDDVLTASGLPTAHTEEEDATLQLGKAEQEIFSFLRCNGEMTADRLCLATGKNISLITGIITVLEMKGLVQTAAGKIFVAK